MRLFIAIGLPEPVREELWRGAERLQAISVSGRYAARESYHITLRFLGEQPESRLSDLARAMAGCEAAPFSLRLGEFGRFGQRDGDVIWRGIEPSAELECLHRSLTRQLTAVCFPVEDRPFVPHLTLARRVQLRDGHSLAELNRDVKRLSFLVTGITLMRSDLSPSGPKYTPMYERRF